MLGLVAQESVWQVAAWFTVAIALLDSFDIALPRGDSVGVSGALVVAALLVVGPLPALAAAFVALVASQLIGRHRLAAKMLGESLLIRTVAIAGAWLVAAEGLWGLAPTPLLFEAVLVAATYLLLELLMSQIIISRWTHRSLFRLVRGNVNRQGLMLVSQVSAAALVVVTFEDMGVWSLVPVVGLLLLMRQSYAMLLDMRETYRATVEILVEAAEGQDARLKGHADRTAKIAREICMRLGLSPADVERVSYSALLHDVYAIAGTFGKDATDEQGGASTMLEGVEFFSEVLPVLRTIDGGSEAGRESERTLLLAMVVALSSDIDTADHPEVAEVHACSATANVSGLLAGGAKAKVVSAALELGFRIPAVS